MDNGEHPGEPDEVEAVASPPTEGDGVLCGISHDERGNCGGDRDDEREAARIRVDTARGSVTGQTGSARSVASRDDDRSPPMPGPGRPAWAKGRTAQPYFP
jgi:hypothetical protein